MPSAGAMFPPRITPLKKTIKSQPYHHIDTNTFIELASESKDSRLFFTTDGTKPLPYNRKIVGREITFRYIAPFCLKQGKRVINAISVSRDGLRESDVMTRTFNVDAIKPCLDTGDVTDLELTDGNTNNTAFTKERKPRSTKTREAWGNHPRISPPATPTPAEYPAQGDTGQFVPTNYSGTQVNLYGGTQGITVTPTGHVTCGGPVTLPAPYNTQYGYLTQQMIDNCNPNRQSLTIGDLRQALEEAIPKDTPAIEAAPVPKIEYPVYKDPPLNAISPGKGDWKEQLLHVYAHLLEYSKQNQDFKLGVSQPQMGKVLNAEFVDEGDGYRISVVVAKPGTTRGSMKKVKKPPPKIEAKVDTRRNTPIVKEKPKETAKAPPKPKPKSDPYYEMETENLDHEGTLKPYPNFNADLDCEILKGAMKGIGTDEDTLINVLAYRSSPQRVQIVETYKALYGKELVEDLKSELSGNLLTAMKSLCHGPAAFDANCLRKAIKGLGTDEDVLIEILCTRSNAQIKEIIKTYQQMFSKDLEKDIIGDTSGNFKCLLVSLVQANRSDSNDVDRNKAHQDARSLFEAGEKKANRSDSSDVDRNTAHQDTRSLYEAGEKKWGTDESKFNAILVTRSYPQLRATFEEYAKISKKDIVDVLKSEMSGDLLRGMLTIVRCVRNKVAHFARALQKTMKGAGTDDDTLIRVCVSRCEMDMVQIKDEFSKLTGQTLEQFITDDISGDYQKVVLALVSGGAAPDVTAQSGKAFVAATRAKTDEQLDEDVKLATEQIAADPTVTPADPFNAEADADVLRKAMKGLGTDEEAIISVLPYRSTAQRLEIASAFKSEFGRDLIKDLKSELSGGFEKLMMYMCLSAAQFDATMINKAVKYLGTDDEALIEIICTRTNQQIADYTTEYQTLFGKSLEDDVSSDTSGDYRKLLISLLQAKRPEEDTFDRAKAKRDAQKMFEDGEQKRFGTVESTFNSILVMQSYPQLRATFQEYAKISQNDIEDALKKEMSGNLLKGLVSIVRCIRSKPAHFAKELHESMKGVGTDDDRMIRVVVGRCEVDMVQIKEEFQKLYKQTLGQFIQSDTSGDYRKTLLALIRDEAAGKSK